MDRMKYPLYVFICLLYQICLGQDNKNTDLSFYSYLSINDLKNDDGKYHGKFSSYSWNSWGKNNIFVVKELKEEKVNINKYWGFKINNNIFRNHKSSPKIPLRIISIKEKIFYIDGYFFLGSLKYGISSSSRTKEAVFYSDTFESKIYTIDKLIKKEKNNKKLLAITNCLKKAKKRYGYQAKFNSYCKCIEEFTSK